MGLVLGLGLGLGSVGQAQGREMGKVLVPRLH